MSALPCHGDPSQAENVVGILTRNVDRCRRYLFAEKPDFEEGIILRGGATIEHVVSSVSLIQPRRQTLLQLLTLCFLFSVPRCSQNPRCAVQIRFGVGMYIDICFTEESSAASCLIRCGQTEETKVWVQQNTTYSISTLSRLDQVDHFGQTRGFRHTLLFNFVKAISRPKCSVVFP